MMDSLIETWKRNGYTVELHYDEGRSDLNPRDNDGNFLFLGFPHRDYKIGDETFDPGEGFECKACDGRGTDYESGDECPKCEGQGRIHASNLDELLLMIQEEYKAHLVLPVGMIDHSGVHYYIGGGAHWSDSAGWDSGTCGVILDTPETLAVRGFPDPLTEEWLREGMAAEIGEYSKWANGEVYGYVIKDRNGDDVESCWGFIGYEYAQQEANEAADVADAQPPKLYDVRLTKDEIEMMQAACAECFDGEIKTGLLVKLEAIDTDEEDEDG